MIDIIEILTANLGLRPQLDRQVFTSDCVSDPK